MVANFYNEEKGMQKNCVSTCKKNYLNFKHFPHFTEF